jgi:hypothetical protein
MKTKIFPEKVLSEVSVRFRLIHTTDIEKEYLPVNSRYAKNSYYQTSEMLCKPNFRKTSKLL